MICLFQRKAIVLLLLFTITASIRATGQNTPEIQQGVLDLRQWNFSNNKVALAGQWNFYEQELLTNPAKSSAKTIYFPEVLSKSGYGKMQWATYSATILLSAQTEKLAFEIPQLYSSYKLFVNGKLVAENGKPGNTRENTTPQWKPQVSAFNSGGDKLEIVLQIANFYHYNTGAKQPIYLGSAELLDNQHTIATNSNLAECVTLIILGFAFFVIYYVRQEKKKITLYFSLLCISWAIRSMFSNNYVITELFPDFDWTWMVRIEYITLYSMLIWTVLFFSKLFPAESSKIIKYIFVIINCTFIAETLIMSPIFFTKWIALYLIVAVLVLIHSAVITIRALLKERAGVWYLVFSLVVAMILFSYDILVFEGYFQYYNALLFSIGYILIFVLMGITLFYHLKIFKGDGVSGTLTFDDLYNPETAKERS